VAGGVATQGLACWDGNRWSALGPLSNNVLALEGSGRSLFAGGLFESSPAADSYLARWACTGFPTEVHLRKR
jgi:hypothetical protein